MTEPPAERGSDLFLTALLREKLQVAPLRCPQVFTSQSQAPGLGFFPHAGDFKGLSCSSWTKGLWGGTGGGPAMASAGSCYHIARKGPSHSCSSTGRHSWDLLCLLALSLETNLHDFLKTFSKSHLGLTSRSDLPSLPQTWCLLGLPQQDKCTELMGSFFSEQGYTWKNTMIIAVFNSRSVNVRLHPRLLFLLVVQGFIRKTQM